MTEMYDDRVLKLGLGSVIVYHSEQARRSSNPTVFSLLGTVNSAPLLWPLYACMYVSMYVCMYVWRREQQETEDCISVPCCMLCSSAQPSPIRFLQSGPVQHAQTSPYNHVEKESACDAIHDRGARTTAIPGAEQMKCIWGFWKRAAGRRSFFVGWARQVRQGRQGKRLNTFVLRSAIKAMLAHSCVRSFRSSSQPASARLGLARLEQYSTSPATIFTSSN